MRLLIKRLSVAAMCAVIFLFSAVDCSAADLSGSMSVPSMVTKGKNFTVGLQAQCPEKLGTVMFTVVFSDNIQYKSCKVNDSNGYIKSYCTDNILRVVYINTLGINVSNINQLVNVTFKAADDLGSGTVQVYTSYSASVNEQDLQDSTGTEYSFDIVSKTSGSVPQARGTELKTKAPSSSSSAAAKNKNKSSSANKKSSSAKKDSSASYNEADSEAGGISQLNIAGQNNGLTLFLAGGVFALAVVAVVVCSYFAGKKNGNSKNEKRNNKN
ncbi:hypothetical protein ACTQ3L_02335 [Oscillospiraceae bacterium LCP25S3_E4]